MTLTLRSSTESRAMERNGVYIASLTRHTSILATGLWSSILSPFVALLACPLRSTSAFGRRADQTLVIFSQISIDGASDVPLKSQFRWPEEFFYQWRQEKDRVVIGEQMLRLNLRIECRK